MGTPIEEALANLSNVVDPEPGFGLGGGASAIADLTDVNLISAQDGDVLVLSSDVWVNQSLGSAITAGISTWVGAAPSDLNTLQEIADRFADDEDIVTSLVSTVGGKLTKSSNLSDLTNVGTARTNLGLGSAALRADTYFEVAGVAAALVDDLSGVTDAATARTNLGLGSAATYAATDFKTVAAYDVRQPGTSAQDNTFAVGVNALNALTSGARNIAIGKGSAAALTGGSDNIVLGDGAMASGTGATQNVAIGTGALSTLDNGGQANIAIGYWAMKNSNPNSASYNVAIGQQAMQNSGVAAHCTAIGATAQQNATPGDDTTAIGYKTLYDNTGAGNTAVGASAGLSIVSGANNTFLGLNAGNTDGTTATTSTVNKAVAIGYNAQATASNVFVIGGKLTVDRLSLCLGNYGDIGGGVGVFALSDASTVPTTNPTGGGILYSQGGALKWRDSGGTIRTLSSNYEVAGVAAALVDDLSGVTDAATARTNLGLGSAATHATTDYEAAGTAVLKSLVDAKGDIFVGSANDAVARLAVGTDGQVLTADSASTNGVKWAAAGGGGGVSNLAALARTGTYYSVAFCVPDGQGGITGTGMFNPATTSGTLTNIPYNDRALGLATVLDTTATINSNATLRSQQSVHTGYKFVYTIGFSLVSLADIRFVAGLLQTNPQSGVLDQDDPSTSGVANQYVMLEISPTLNSGNITLVYGNNGGVTGYGSVDTGIAPSALTKYIFVVDFTSGTNSMVCSIYNAAGTQLYTTTITDATKIPLYNTNGGLLRGAAGLKNLVASSKKWYFHGESIVFAA